MPYNALFNTNLIIYVSIVLFPHPTTQGAIRGFQQPQNWTAPPIRHIRCMQQRAPSPRHCHPAPPRL